MAAKRCPNCKLVNPGSATKCDCGYSFADGSVGAPLDLGKPGAPRVAPGHDNAFMIRLAIRLIVGLAVTGIVLAIRYCGLPK